MPGGEDAGQDRAQRAADAVDAEGIERIVVAERRFELVQARKQTMPAATPMTSAGIGLTKPEAGVMQTRPATAPEHAPSTVGLPRVIHSMPAQASAPAAAAKCVAQKALAARPSAASALPALKPNQPTHSMRRAERRVGQVVRRHRLAAEAQPLAHEQQRRSGPKRPS